MTAVKFAAVLVLLAQQRCSLQSPELTAQQTQQALISYFPRVQTQLSKNAYVVAFTCADLGLKAVQMLQPVIDQQPQIQQLRKAGAFAPLMAGVRGFALVFPDYVLALDMPTQQDRIYQDPYWKGEYERLCEPLH